jgi:hypothetical protein
LSIAEERPTFHAHTYISFCTADDHAINLGARVKSEGYESGGEVEVVDFEVRGRTG